MKQFLKGSTAAAAILLFSTVSANAATSVGVNPTNYSGATEEENFDLEFNDEFATDAKVNDPLEPFNRAVFEFNAVVDDFLLEPVAKGYKQVVPQWGRDRVSNVLSNLSEPVNLVNSTLQGKGEGALTAVWRFIINTTFGVLGTFDAASEVGLEHKSEGFGQTLYSWGATDSPYLVLPILGPSTVRDGVGTVADYFSNPFNYDSVVGQDERLAIGVTTAIATRAGLLDTTAKIEAQALDPYVAYRSFYLQNFEKRAKE